MRTMNTPVEMTLGSVSLRLERDGSSHHLLVTNRGQVPLRGVTVAFRTSSEVGANPTQFSYNTIPVGVTTPPQRVELRFAPTIQQAVPAYAYPVYVLEFEVVSMSPKDRMSGALHISFA